MEKIATERRKRHYYRVLDNHEEIGVKMRFEGENVVLDNELIDAEWKPNWRKVKTTLKKGV